MKFSIFPSPSKHLSTQAGCPETQLAAHDGCHRQRSPSALIRLGLCAVVAVCGLIAANAISAEDSPLPGMCKGRSDANLVVNIHAQDPKFILNLSTDTLGVPYGVLILEKGRERLYVDLFCRVWTHLPGQTTGEECEGEPHPTQSSESHGSTVAHAVGMGALHDGTPVLVRADARETEGGKFFRVRYKTMQSHEGHGENLITPSAHEDHNEDEDEGWTRIPAEGWAPLKLLKIRAVAP